MTPPVTPELELITLTFVFFTSLGSALNLFVSLINAPSTTTDDEKGLRILGVIASSVLVVLSLTALFFNASADANRNVRVRIVKTYTTYSVVENVTNPR